MGRRVITSVTVVLLVVLSTGPAVAFEIDIRDPSIFGPGEGWEPGILQPGSNNPWVAELQEELNRAGFRVATIDGVFGTQTVAAVHAFQKLHGLERDAVFRPEHWDLLDEPLPSLGQTGEANRIEVDLSRQLLFLVQNHEVRRVLSVSSGNGQAYANYAGNIVSARTPEGRFAFNRQRSGWHRSYLGMMYAPFYFRGGYAIHGSTSVPAYPASHGCVRVTLSDMDYLRQSVELGMPVYVYGNRVEREVLLPTPPAPPPVAPQIHVVF